MSCNRNPPPPHAVSMISPLVPIITIKLSRAQNWFVKNKLEKETGPFTIGTMKLMWESEEVQQDTFVKTNGMEDYSQVRYVASLFKALAVSHEAMEQMFEKQDPSPRPSKDQVEKNAMEETKPKTMAKIMDLVNDPRNLLWYYLDLLKKSESETADVETVGPLVFSELLDLWMKGMITEDTFMWSQDLSDHFQIKAIPKLKASLESKRAIPNHIIISHLVPIEYLISC